MHSLRTIEERRRSRYKAGRIAGNAVDANSAASEPFIPSPARSGISGPASSAASAQPAHLIPFCFPLPSLAIHSCLGKPVLNSTDTMSTPIIIGVGAIAAALTGRHLMKRGLLGGKSAAEQWVKGGFKAKMDRAEAVAILGLKCVATTVSLHSILNT